MTTTEHTPHVEIVYQGREGRRTLRGYKILTIITLSDGTQFQGTNAEAIEFLAQRGLKVGAAP